jgi:histone deacetylase complex regulatory component SIN3
VQRSYILSPRSSAHSLPIADLAVRVSDLFDGNPALLGGLNLFLPADFAIVCAETDDGRVVTITAPTGVTTRTYPAGA